MIFFGQEKFCNAFNILNVFYGSKYFIVDYNYENFEIHGPHIPLARNYPVEMNCQKHSYYKIGHVH